MQWCTSRMVRMFYTVSEAKMYVFSIVQFVSLTRHHFPPTYPIQTPSILHCLEIGQDVACTVDLTFDLVLLLPLWPPTWPSVSRCVDCSAPAFLHRVVRSGDHTWQRGARPGQGLFTHYHLLRFRGDHLGLQESWRAIFTGGEQWSKLRNRAKQRHN